jgi:hypothetical protein
MNNKIDTIKQVVEKNFTLDKEKIIFIYTPPKVGSTTLVSSLRISLSLKCNVIHIHDDIMLNVLSGINNISINEIIEYVSSLGKDVYVIDIYRNPIERKMSEFFEKISPYHFNNTDQAICSYKLNRIIIRFNKVFPYLGLGDHYFDKYNIDNPIPFDFVNKYTIQVLNKIKYIKLRLCDANLWGGILSQIFKNEIIIINDYQTETKLIGVLYKKFKNEYKIPTNYLEVISKCKYLNFYNSEIERNNYLNVWKRKIGAHFTPYNNSEYKFYINLCLENQYINDIQTEHYIDNGCYCKLCNKKRNEIFIKAKNGEKITEKIIHYDVINNEIDNRNQKLTQLIKQKLSTKKFQPSQFSITHINK